MLLSKCSACDNKKSKYIKELEATTFLSSLGIKAPLIKMPVLSPLLFHSY